MGIDLELLNKECFLLEQQLSRIAEIEPFWFYVPSTGDIGVKEKEFLRRWLKEEDIPQKLDGQLDVFQSVAPIRAVFGGNQSGKSTVLAISSYIAMTGELPHSLIGKYPEELLPKKFPIRGRVVGVDHKTLMNTLIPTFKSWVPKEYLRGGSWDDSYSSEQNVLRLYRGNEEIASCDFMTNQQEVESFQGPPRDFIFYDEEPRLEIYRENLMRFTTAERMNIMFAMTPTHGVGSWVYDEIVQKQEIGSVKAECFKLASITNSRANLDVLEEILKQVGSYEDIQMRLLGSFVSLSGLVYGKLFKRNVHVIEPFPITREFMVVRGIDPHLVKPTVCVEMAVDREDNCYVIGVYRGEGDVEEIKRDLRKRVAPYRTGWTMCDKSADSNLKVLGDRNIFRELSTGEAAIPALFTSEKYTGSINAGVDEIKRRLKINEKTGKPSLFIFNTPENKILINAFQTLEREVRPQEEKRGVLDKIAEGKHDAHAALRYIFQRVVRWVPEMQGAPEYVPDNANIGY